MNLCTKSNPTVNDAIALKNIAGMREAMISLGLSGEELSRRARIHASLVSNYVKGDSVPTVMSYNKLAKVFGWPKLPCSMEKQRVLASESIIPQRRITFTVGKCYVIGGKVIQSDAFILMYESKQGIHHVFREIRGKWITTYTDAQLIGKKVQEVGCTW